MTTGRQCLAVMGGFIFGLWFLLAIVLPTIDKIVERMAAR